MKNIIKEHKYFFILLAAYICAETAFLIFYGNKIWQTTDTVSYVHVARNIVNEGSFSWIKGIECFRTPGYPLFLAVTLSIWDNLLFVQIAQLIFSCAGFCFIYYIVRRASKNNRAALAACSLYFLDINHYIFDVTLMTENIFAFLMLPALLSFIFFAEKKKTVWVILLALALNYAMLTRPILIYFNGFLSVAFLAAAFARKINYRQAFVFAAVFLLAYGGWSARNYYKEKVFIFSTVRHVNLFYLEAPRVLHEIMPPGTGLFDAISVVLKATDSAYPPETLQGLSDTQVYILKGEIGSAIIKQHKWIYFKMNLKGLWRIFFEIDTLTMGLRKTIWAEIFKVLFALPLLAVYAVYACGFIKAFANRRLTLADIYIFCLSGYLCAASASVGDNRFRTAFFPLLVIGAFLLYAKNIQTKNKK